MRLLKARREDQAAAHWLTLGLFTVLLLAFLLAACLSEAWPHLHPSSVEMLAPTATTVELELVFAAADAATLAALAPAGLRRAAATGLRDALRAVPGAIRWRVRVSTRQAVLPLVGEEEALLTRPARGSALRFHVLLQRASPLTACSCGVVALATEAPVGWVRPAVASSVGVTACVANSSGALDALARTLDAELGARVRVLASPGTAASLRPSDRVALTLLQAAPGAAVRRERGARLARLRRRAQRLLWRAFPRAPPQLHSQVRHYARLGSPLAYDARLGAYVVSEEQAAQALGCGGAASCGAGVTSVMPEPPATVLLYAADAPLAPLRLVDRGGAPLPPGHGFSLPAAGGGGGAAGGGFLLWSDRRAGGGGGGNGGNAAAVLAQLRLLLGLGAAPAGDEAAPAAPPSCAALSHGSSSMSTAWHEHGMSTVAWPRPLRRVAAASPAGVNWLEAAALQFGCAHAELAAAAAEAAEASVRLAAAAHARRAVWPLLRDASRHAAAATTLLRDPATWPDACAEAVAARHAARAATHHPELVPLSQFGAQDAATVYGPLFFPLVTCVCSALWHEVQRARSARGAKRRTT